MKRLIIFLILFLAYSVNVKSQVSNIKKFLEATPLLRPFHIIKDTGEKISSLGLNHLLFGLTATGLVLEAISKPEDKNIHTLNPKKNNNTIRKITAIGQVHINNIDENEAKKRALEDALYYAAIKGGAKVNGYSSVNNDTSIEEHFTVRPKSQILDYRILKSYIKEEIYIVEVEAVVGDISIKSEVCNNNKPIIIKEFKGSHSINTNIAAVYDNYGRVIIDLISNNLNSLENVSYYNNKNNYYDFNKAQFDLSYDYKTLVNGLQSVSYGDFIYIPNIKLIKSKVYPITYLVRNKEKVNVENPGYFFDTDVLKVIVSIDIYNGVSNELISKIDENYLIPLNIDSNFEYLELFTKNDQEYIYSEILNISKDLSNIITKNLICQPLTANINYINNKLIVPLGTKNGIRKNQLAVLENTNLDSNWTILSVNSLTNNSATLIPLNSNVKINELSGKKTRFLE